MAVTALIKFVQGVTVGADGQALFGAVGTPVVTSNVSNAGVTRWVWTVLDVPPGSAVPTGVVSDGPVPTLTFTPDVEHSYFVRLDTYDSSGKTARDERVFAVQNVAGRWIAPAGAKGPALNFSGQARGWSPGAEDYLRSVDGSWKVGPTGRVYSFAGELATPGAGATSVVVADPQKIFDTFPAGAAVDAIVTATTADGSDRARFALSALFKIAAGGAITQDGTTDVTYTKASAGAGTWAATVDTSTGFIRLRVTGEAARDVRWVGVLQVSGRGV